jgi:hypothetical protein
MRSPPLASAALSDGMRSPPLASAALNDVPSRPLSTAALGMGGCTLQDHLSYAQLMSAVLGEDGALAAASAPNGHGMPPLYGALLARLCWLISCWWGFGGRDDAAEDEASCAASYAFLVRQLNAHHADMGVRLQAAHVLETLVRSAGDGDLPLVAPHAPHALVGLAALLGSCRADAACLWTLRAMTTLLRRLPAAALTAEAHASALPVLDALWQRAEREQRTLLLRALRRVAAASRAHRPEA